MQKNLYRYLKKFDLSQPFFILLFFSVSIYPLFFYITRKKCVLGAKLLYNSKCPSSSLSVRNESILIRIYFMNHHIMLILSSAFPVICLPVLPFYNEELRYNMDFVFLVNMETKPPTFSLTEYQHNNAFEWS